MPLGWRINTCCREWLPGARLQHNLKRHSSTSMARAPKEREYLLQRTTDRELPKYRPQWVPIAQTFPIFVAVMWLAAIGLFNYQKQNSSVVSSTLYALRYNDVGKRELGDGIYYRDKWPWIWGELNQLHGRIDISYAVKGSKTSGMMRFRCERKARRGRVSSIIFACSTDARLKSLNL